MHILYFTRLYRFLVARCLGFPDPESVPELAQNPRRTAVLDKRIWNDTMWSMICWGQTAQTVVFALYASWSLHGCCFFDSGLVVCKIASFPKHAFLVLFPIRQQIGLLQ